MIDPHNDYSSDDRIPGPLAELIDETTCAERVLGVDAGRRWWGEPALLDDDERAGVIDGLRGDVDRFVELVTSGRAEAP